MELKILSDIENKLLNRREIKFSISQESATPKKSEIHQALCKMLNLKPEGTIIVRISQNFGARDSTGIAHSYPDASTLSKIEPRYLLDRLSGKKRKAAPAAQAAPAQQQEAEKKQEQKTEK